MLDISKDNLHHAYLLEGEKGEILPLLLEFIKDIGVETVANPDFTHIEIDVFKIDDARNLKSLAGERSGDGKRIFVISANSILLEAQNTLLKTFEEPKDNTHYFVIVPEKSSLLPTFVSRFYSISTKDESKNKEAESFIKMPVLKRIDFLKELLTEEEEEGEMSARTKAIKFLNSLEFLLHERMSKGTFDLEAFEQILKVRKFLRQPGSSPKTLMESVALFIPVIQ